MILAADRRAWRDRSPQSRGPAGSGSARAALVSALMDWRGVRSSNAIRSRDVDHPDRLVEMSLIDDEPGMGGVLEHLDSSPSGMSCWHRDDIGARHHEVVDDAARAELKDVLEHLAPRLGERSRSRPPTAVEHGPLNRIGSKWGSSQNTTRAIMRSEPRIAVSRAQVPAWQRRAQPGKITTARCWHRQQIDIRSARCCQPWHVKIRSARRRVTHRDRRMPICARISRSSRSAVARPLPSDMVIVS